MTNPLVNNHKHVHTTTDFKINNLGEKSLQNSKYYTLMLPNPNQRLLSGPKYEGRLYNEETWQAN